ncbi:MAG: hypothetical protein CL424_11280 [Acidimicrobiaceae bacterium]|nr:hypothetical protein [Acidimicrobiaceae bacterium]
MQLARTAALVVALAACGGDGAPDDPATAAACAHFEQTMRAFRAGELDYAGLQDGMAEVDAAAGDSTNESVRLLAARMVETLDFRPADEFVDALRSFSRACER